MDWAGLGLLRWNWGVLLPCCFMVPASAAGALTPARCCSLYLAVSSVWRSVWVEGGWPHVPVCFTDLRYVPESRSPRLVYNLIFPLLQWVPFALPEPPFVYVWSYGPIALTSSPIWILLPLFFKNLFSFYLRLSLSCSRVLVYLLFCFFFKPSFQWVLGRKRSKQCSVCILVLET